MSNDKFEKIMDSIFLCLGVLACTFLAFAVLDMGLDVLRKF